MKSMNRAVVPVLAIVVLAIVVLAVVALAVGVSSGASAQANCDWYAKMALKQQQDNERLKCGFKGDAWTSDLKAHAAWCATVSPDDWKKQAQKRDQDLAQCQKK